MKNGPIDHSPKHHQKSDEGQSGHYVEPIFRIVLLLRVPSGGGLGCDLFCEDPFAEFVIVWSKRTSGFGVTAAAAAAAT